MIKKILLASLFAAAATTSAAALAEPQTWSFSYQGFFDERAGLWNPGHTVSGSFSGEDLNHDRKIGLDELSSLIIAGQEYGPSCSPVFYFNCYTNTFQFDTGTGCVFR